MKNQELIEKLCIDVYAHHLNNDMQQVSTIADRVINVLHGDPEVWREANEQKIRERLHTIRKSQGWDDETEESL